MKALLMYLLTGLLIGNPMFDTNLLKQEEKVRARLSVSYYNIPNKEYLTVKVTGQKERRYEPVENIGVSLYLGEQSEQNFLGRIISDADGQGQLVLPQEYYTASDTLKTLDFIAVLEENPILLDKTEELTIKKVNLDLDFVDKDSLKQVHSYLFEKDSLGLDKPVKRVEIKFSVQRPLGLLPVSEDLNFTNEEGKVSINFPNDLPGDHEGHITLVVKIVDNDDYGNIEKSETLKWGIPTKIDDETIQRSLWASGANAPIPLLLLVNSLILATWGILIFIIVKIFHIKRI